MNDNMHRLMDANWRTLARLLAHLARAGHTLAAVTDGAGERYTVARDGYKDCLDAATSCDDATLLMITDGQDGSSSRLLLIWGNGPGELVADGTNPEGRIWDDVQAWSDAEAEAAAREAEPAPEPAHAEAIPGALAIASHATDPEGVGIVELDYDGTYEGFTRAPAGLTYAGRVYARTGHNSDTMRIYYRTDAPLAQSIK